MEKIYTRPSYIREGATSGFCPGCMHSTVHKLVGEVLDELGIVDKTVTVWGVGCCILGSGYTTHDSFGSPHGRACAMASAYKRCNPDEIVYTYQGDGDLAPTTLVGQKATTAPFGRDPKQHGYPVHVCELLATLKAPAYLERVTCVDAPNVLKAKAAIKKAFQNQIDGKGFSLVEIMSNCPTNWGMAPLETLEYMKEHTLKEFPLGVYRDR